jgi:hypothetical protein
MDKNRVYMDSCCFIDLVKYRDYDKPTHNVSEEKFNDVWHLRRLCDAALKGDIEIISSTLAIAECLHEGNQLIGDIAKDLFEKFLTSGRVILPIEAGYNVCVQARDLYWRHRILLSGADQVHVASAIETNCKEFITTDDKIKKEKIQQLIKTISTIKDIKIIHASQTQLLPEAYRQNKIKEVIT